MNFENFFIKNNKSGYKTKEKWLKNNHLTLYNNIIEHSDKYGFTDKLFKEKIWLYINNIKTQPICECGKELKFKRTLKEGYGKYCSKKCMNKSSEHKKKVKETNNEKYGGNSPMSSDVVKNKQKNSVKNKYGVDNIFKDVEYIKTKTIEKYNVEHISKLVSVKNKIKNTNKNKYGIDYPIKLFKNRIKGYEIKKEIFLKKYSDLNIINISNDDITINCDKCGNDYLINRNVLYHRYDLKYNPCTICNPIKNGVSISEKELVDFILSLNIDIIQNDRTILNGKEIDILIPSHKIGIEFNGLFWHSEQFVDKNYHLNKTELCKKEGYQLIHIFEDEWVNKKEIIKSRLKNILGLTKNKIYARNCEIKEVGTSEKTKFLNKNHIQGAIGSKTNIGLYYNNELVSIMTFGDKRIALGSSKCKNGYELIRFCNKLDYNVVGGASKLLKYFIKNYKPKEIISYADRRWSSGNLYEKLGFNKVKITTPNYWYLINNKREHRFKYRKNKLVEMGYNQNMSEREIMLENNIYRIWDCGNILFSISY